MLDLFVLMTCTKEDFKGFGMLFVIQIRKMMQYTCDG